jgi:antirestriction protein ArdC
MAQATPIKRDLYSEVTSRILAELERGAAPWVKPWSARPMHDDHWIAEIDALLDGRDYSVIPYCHFGWLQWAEFAAEMI